MLHGTGQAWANKNWVDGADFEIALFEDQIRKSYRAK
jgi:hypothetical protein